MRARKAWLATHRADVLTDHDMLSIMAFRGFDDERYPPPLRRLLGDDEYAQIFVDTQKDMDEAKRLFPEADVFFASDPR